MTTQAEIGFRYERAVATLVAANLSKHPDVEDYYIFLNLTEAEPFDDVVVKVLFREESLYYAYAIQVKHCVRGEHCIVEKYREGYTRILSQKGFNTIGDIAHDKIHFCYVCINNVTNQGEYKPYAFFDVLGKGDSWRLALPFQNCHKLGKPMSENDFLNKFYLYFDQPDLDNIKIKIENECKLNDATEILEYVYNFVKHNTLRSRGLSKHVFETELLKIRLSDNIEPLVDIRLNNLPGTKWKDLTSENYVTIVETENDIEKILYGLLAQMMDHLFDIDKWNNYRTEMDPIVSENFEKLFAEDTRVRHWINPPNTLKTLIIELWKYGEVPLILRADKELSALKDYVHLNKRYIMVTDNLEKRQEEINKIPISLFTHISDIKNQKIREDILTTIPISIQGRKVIQLYSLFANGNDELGKTLSFSDILHLAKRRECKRDVYLSKECLKGNHNMLFLIEDPRSSGDYDFDKMNYNGCNITITCRSNQIDNNRELIKEKFRNYKTYHCRASLKNKNFALVEENYPELLRDFFVDEDEESVYVRENEPVVPIVGVSLKSVQRNDILHYLNMAVISELLFDGRTKGICFFTGDVSKIKKNINLVKEDQENLQFNNENRFINVSDTNVDNYWETALRLNCPLLHIRVEGSLMKLYKSKNWKGLTEFITYKGRNIIETKILKEISDGITVLTGEPGIGKSSLLQSLFKNHNMELYTLYYDLCDYDHYLENTSVTPTNNSLDFIFQQSENKRYGKFLNDFIQKKRVLVLLDSFDKVSFKHKEKTLTFLENLAATKVKIIIASRSTADSVLVDRFEINIFQVRSNCNLYIKDSKICKKMKISHKNSQNPFYLDVLQTVENNVNQGDIDKFILIQKCVDKKLNDYVENYLSRHLFDKEKLIKYVREQQFELALKHILGAEVVDKLLPNKPLKHLKSGAVLSINEGSQACLHIMFAEYLTATWLITNIKKQSAKKIYREILNQNKLDVLNILYEGLKLHKAVAKKNITLVEEETIKFSQLNQTDRLGKTSLHLAAAYWDHSKSWTCWEGGPSDFNSMISIIIEKMCKNGLKKFTSFNADSLMKWNWVQHLNRGDVIDMKPCSKFLITTMERYIKCIVEGLCGSKLVPNLKNFLNERNDSAKDMWLTAMKACKISLLRDLFFIIDAKLNGVNQASSRQLLKENTLDELTRFDRIWGLTPLHVASLYGKLDVVRILLDRGDSVNTTDDFGCTPIFYSIINTFNNRKHITKLLLKKGSNLNRSNNFHYFPLSMAVRSGHLDITTVLLEHGGANHSINRDLFIALERKYQDIAEFLLDHGADANSVNEDGVCALHFLMVTKNRYDSDLVRLLLRKNAEVNYTNQDGQAALMLAIITNNLEGTRFLLDNGADVNKETLRYAIKANNSEIIMLLLQKSAEI